MGSVKLRGRARCDGLADCALQVRIWETVWGKAPYESPHTNPAEMRAL